MTGKTKSKVQYFLLPKKARWPVRTIVTNFVSQNRSNLSTSQLRRVQKFWNIKWSMLPLHLSSSQLGCVLNCVELTQLGWLLVNCKKFPLLLIFKCILFFIYIIIKMYSFYRDSSIKMLFIGQTWIYFLVLSFQSLWQFFWYMVMGGWD